MYSYVPRNPQGNDSEVKEKISALLTVIVSFQNKIEATKEKLCGFPDFSPQLYYNEFDQNKKGFIDAKDIMGFLKTYKQNFKLQPKYLVQMIKNLNIGEVKNGERLSYFGYLNMIKPYFNMELGKDLLLRDTITHGKGNILNKNQTIIQLLHELACLTYVSIAEHEQIKQLIVNEYALNIREISNIIFGDDGFQLKNSLHKFSQFINHNSQYEVDKEQMKYLLAYLRTHEYLLTSENEMTKLFMPTTQVYYEPILNEEPQPEKTENNNFLNYVHPNSQKQPPPLQPQRPIIRPTENDVLHTPILQTFLRESKVLRNMSKRPQTDERQSPFIQESIRPKFNVEELLYNKQVNKSEYMQISKYERQPMRSQQEELEEGSILGNFLLK